MAGCVCVCVFVELWFVSWQLLSGKLVMSGDCQCNTLYLGCRKFRLWIYTRCVSGFCHSWEHCKCHWM